MDIPAGWYPDPSGGPELRYWSGTVWTEQRKPPPLPAKQNNRLAIISLVVSVAGFLFVGLGPLAGLVLGYIALSQIKRSAGRQRGRGLALASIWLGWVAVGLWIMAIIGMTVGGA